MSTDASRRVGAIIARALPLLTLSTPLVAAQPDDFCPPLPDASGVHVFEDAQNPSLSYTIDPTHVFVPDRRPVALIAPYNGSYNEAPDNALGWSGWFRDPATAGDELVARLELAWQRGFRRFCLNRPGGTLQNNDMVQMSMFHYLDHDRRIAYLVQMRQWIDAKRQIDPNAELGIFIGSRHNSPCTPCLEPTGILNDGYTCADDPLYLPGWQGRLDAGHRPSAEWTWQNLSPWIDSGVNAFWFDSAALAGNTTGTMSMQESILALQHNPDYAGIKISGEAVPIGSWSNNVFSPHPSVYKAAWVAIHSFFLSVHRDNEDYDPQTTEIGVGFMNPDAGAGYDIHDVAEFRDRGYVAWAWRNFAHPFIQRTHDGDNDEFYNAVVADGTLADFNADEVVDYQDILDFVTRFTAIDRPARPAIWDADINNDDDVDYNDVLAYLIAFAGH